MVDDQLIKTLVEKHIRPKSRVDGGDLRFESYEDGVVIIGAHSACATCLCCEDRLLEWLKNEIQTQLKLPQIEVFIKRYIPYYKR